jgi:hypothetical protein
LSHSASPDHAFHFLYFMMFWHLGPNLPRRDCSCFPWLANSYIANDLPVSLPLMYMKTNCSVVTSTLETMDKGLLKHRNLCKRNWGGTSSKLAPWISMPCGFYWVQQVAKNYFCKQSIVMLASAGKSHNIAD